MMNTSHLDPASEAFADRLAQDPDYRILRKLPRPFSEMTGEGGPPEGMCVALVDTETTSLDAENGKIIEIAVKLLWLEETGELLGHFPIFSWLEDPGHPLDPEISRITGLRDSDLAGKAIDDEAVVRLLGRADLIVAHNCAFDLRWIEKRWPQLSGMPWACSCAEIDWPGLGFEGRSLQFLLQQHGWFSIPHRAAGDVWTLFSLLQQVRSDPHEARDQFDEHRDSKVRTHLQRLLEASARPSVKIMAVGAPFNSRHLLQQRGYRWDSDAQRKFWWREVNSDDVEAELIWFRRNAIPAPRCLPITARQRHR